MSASWARGIEFKTDAGCVGLADGFDGADKFNQLGFVGRQGVQNGIDFEIGIIDKKHCVLKVDVTLNSGDNLGFGELDLTGLFGS